MSGHQPLRDNADVSALFSLRRPCPDCPFRLDVPGYLTRARAEEIAQGLEDGVPFFCHATTTKTGYATTDRRARYCAGSLLYGQAVHRHTLHARLAIHLGLWDPGDLKRDVPVHDTREGFVGHHGGGA